jgi:hypothetical protein
MRRGSVEDDVKAIAAYLNRCLVKVRLQRPLQKRNRK